MNVSNTLKSCNYKGVLFCPEWDWLSTFVKKTHIVDTITYISSCVLSYMCEQIRNMWFYGNTGLHVHSVLSIVCVCSQRGHKLSYPYSLFTLHGFSPIGWLRTGFCSPPDWGGLGH